MKPWRQQHCLGRGRLSGVCFSADRRHFATVSSVGVDVYDASTFTHLCALRPPRGVAQAALSSDGSALATTYERGDAERRYVTKQWEVDTAREVGRHEHAQAGQLLYTPAGDVCLVPAGELQAFSADGRWRAHWPAGGQALSIFVDGRCTRQLQVPRPRAVTLSPDGHWLALVTAGAIELWELATGVCRGTHEAAYEAAHDFSADGRLLAFDLADELGVAARTALVNVESGARLPSLSGPGSKALALAFGPRPGLLLTCRPWDDAVRQWDIETGAQLRSVELPDERPTTVVFTASDELIVKDEGRLGEQLWSPAGRWTTRAPAPWQGVASSAITSGAAAEPDAEPCSARVHEETRAVRFLGEHEGFESYPAGVELTVGDRRYVLSADGIPVNGFAFDPTRSYLAAAHGLENLAVPVGVRLWRVADGALQRVLAPDESAFQVGFAANGSLLVASCVSGPHGGPNAGWIHVWRVPSGECLHSFAVRVSRATTRFAISPDGTLLAVAEGSGEGHAVDLWTLGADVCEQQTLRGHVGQTRSVAFSSDGQLLASSGHDGSVRIWAT